MFTQQCYIKKNSKELRERLNAIGHKLNHGKAWGKYLCVFKTEDTKKWVYVASPYWDLKNMPNIENSIDCKENEDLFLAIAALRDDSDIFQYITNGNIVITCELDSMNEFLKIFYDGFIKNDNDLTTHINKWYKLTTKELIEYFK